MLLFPTFILINLSVIRSVWSLYFFTNLDEIKSAVAPQSSNVLVVRECGLVLCCDDLRSPIIEEYNNEDMCVCDVCKRRNISG